MISRPLFFLSLALLILLSFDGGVTAQETRGARREKMGSERARTKIDRTERVSGEGPRTERVRGERASGEGARSERTRSKIGSMKPPLAHEEVVERQEKGRIEREKRLNEMRKKVKDHELGIKVLSNEDYKDLLKSIPVYDEKIKQMKMKLGADSTQRATAQSRRSARSERGNSEGGFKLTREALLGKHEKGRERHEKKLNEMKKKVEDHESGKQELSKDDYEILLKNIPIWEEKLEELKKPLDESYIEQRLKMYEEHLKKRSEL